MKEINWSPELAQEKDDERKVSDGDFEWDDDWV